MYFHAFLAEIYLSIDLSINLSKAKDNYLFEFWTNGINFFFLRK